MSKEIEDVLRSPIVSSNTFSVRWPDLTTIPQHTRSAGLEFRPLPEELGRLPEDIVIPDKLRQIITWSLLPGNSWACRPASHLQGERASVLSSRSGTSFYNVKEQPESPTAALSSRTSVAEQNENVSTSSQKAASIKSASNDRKNSTDVEKSTRARLLSKIGLNVPFIKNVPPAAECTSCFEVFPESAMISLKACRHWYCKDCLAMLITIAMATETSFPPKCCLTPIPLRQVLKSLDAEQREQYRAKSEEYGIPAADRWYCPGTECLKWIPPERLRINKELCYDCPHCSTKICRTCRGPAHPANTDCPEDFGLEATLETADIEGWQRCYKCRALVEHNTGCRHMTCRCRAEFCYVCGLRWLTCQCTEADAANKRAGVQRRREERYAERDAEAAELAQILREIEEMEEREAEERALEEERRQREEEELLQMLENARLEEEVRKKELSDRAEREFHKALVMSFEEEWNEMQQIHETILFFQSEAISSRHKIEDERLGSMSAADSEKIANEFTPIRELLEKNCDRRRKRLTRRQKTALEALEAQQEEEEDDMFVQVQMRLRGKANKESRMEKMLNEMRKQQGEDKNELLEKQKREAEELEEEFEIDYEGVERAKEQKNSEALQNQGISIRKFGHTVAADRQYFELIVERRNRMLAKHAQKALKSIQVGEEPVDLTEYEASQLHPYLPDYSEVGPSGVSRAGSVITSHDALTSAQVPALERLRASPDPMEEKILVSAEVESPELYLAPVVAVKRSSQPQMPGSFPGEHQSSSHQQMPFSTQQVRTSATTRPPTKPLSRPSSHSNQPRTSTDATAPAQPPLQARNSIIRKALPQQNNLRRSSTDTSLLTSEHPSQDYSVATSATLFRVNQLYQPQPQPQPQYLPQTLPQPQYPPQPRAQSQPQLHTQSEIKTPTMSIISIEPDLNPADRRNSSTSGVFKKGRWFRKDKFISEEEIKRQLRANVGDAF